MMKSTIPKYIQVFKKIDPDEIFKNSKDKLIKVFEEGGIKLDDDYLKLNPNAKQKFMFVVSKAPVKNGNKINIDGNSNLGYWIYCGKCYIRKIEDKYEFGTYMAYETKTRKIIDFWDDIKFKTLNEVK